MLCCENYKVPLCLGKTNESSQITVSNFEQYRANKLHFFESFYKKNRMLKLFWFFFLPGESCGSRQAKKPKETNSNKKFCRSNFLVKFLTVKLQELDGEELSKKINLLNSSTTSKWAKKLLTTESPQKTAKNQFEM